MAAATSARMSTNGVPAGLYVHVPFCLTRCGYCDFNAHAGLGHLAPTYVSALEREADLRAGEWAGVPFVSVFFGGGTPTTLPAGDLVRLLEGFRSRFALAPDAEVTVEANPDTVDRAYLRELRRGGVTRLSMGVQSFDPHVLEALERVHGPDSARRAFAAARDAGFDDVNLDLIYGVRGERAASWEGTLAEAVALGPEHLSCYALTIEPATPLERKTAAGLVPPPDPDVQADRYERACAVLAEAGYEHYEVSNWAKRGRRCRHNDGYWEGRPYLGLGAGAHSFDGARRWWNVRPPAHYVQMARAGEAPVGGEERVGPDERALERLLLGLRRADGVPAGWVDEARLAPFDEVLTRRDGRVALTERGMFLANEVVLALTD